ncbi:hypothetical protein J6590_013520 [Homalodisca vitripennis]|nr:hypothetical protein J6590_013520 [Homalodisca vitripennis]
MPMVNGDRHGRNKMTAKRRDGSRKIIKFSQHFPVTQRLETSCTSFGSKPDNVTRLAGANDFDAHLHSQIVHK